VQSGAKRHEGTSNHGQLDETIRQRAVQSAMFQKDEVRPLFLLLQHLEERDAGVCRLGTQVQPGVTFEALLLKDLPIGGPFLTQRRRHHDDNRPTPSKAIQKDRSRHGESDEGLTHTAGW
jgi:hypothetical protein